MEKLEPRKNNWKLDTKPNQRNVSSKRYSLRFGQNL